MDVGEPLRQDVKRTRLGASEKEAEVSELDFQTRRIDALPHTTLITLSGSIDAKTVPDFQANLEKLKDEDVVRFILDMENIKYVNSTGLGSLVNLADTLDKQGGGVALLRIQPKVKVVFDMLGLNTFFSIFSEVDEAIAHFREAAQAPVAQATPVTAVEEEAPARVRAERVAVPTARAVIMEVQQEAGREELKASIECAICHVPLFVPEPGNYKCPRCQAVFTYLREGKANFLPRRKLSPIQFVLAATEECTEGFVLFVSVLARKLGFQEDDIARIGESLRETCSTIIEGAYKGNSQCSYQALVVMANGELNIKISDYGKIINPRTKDAEGAMPFELTRKVMDKFELKPHPKGGNILSLMKRCKQ